MNFDQAVDQARTMLVEGVIQGQPFADTIEQILGKAIEFGTEEAKHSDFFFVSTCLTEDEVKSAAVEQAVNCLFSDRGIAGVARETVMIGAAFGFQQAKRKIKYADIEAAVERTLAEAVENEGKVSPETMEEFFQQTFVLINNSDVENAVGYIRQVLVSAKPAVRFDTTKVPSFKEFSNLYAKYIIG